MAAPTPRLPLGIAPNLLDRAIATVAPKYAVERLHARAVLAAVTGFGYNGGKTTRKTLGDWKPMAGSADTDTLFESYTLRARSRDLARNEPLAAGAISTVVENVIGTGLDLLPRPDRELLGWSDAEAEEWEQAVYRLFRMWAGSTNADITGAQTFYGMQGLALRSVLESGDLGVLRRFKERKAELFGTRLAFVEADRISNPDNATDTTKLAAGVEVDDDGRMVRFYVRNQHPGDLLAAVNAGPGTWVPVDVDNDAGDRQALLLFKKLRPGQRRGVAYLAPVIEHIKLLGRYSDAEVTNAVVSAFFSVFVKTVGGKGLGVQDEDREAVDPTPAGDYRLAPGAIIDLAPDESVEFANPGRPNAQFDPFWVSIVRQIAVGLDLPFEILVKHFQSSYAASRAAFLEAWRFFRGRRAWVVESFCQPVYEWFLDECVARGLVAAPGWDDPLLRLAYTNAEWQGDAPGMLDPIKEVAAAKERMNYTLTTLEEETSAMTGKNWRHNIRQREKELKLLDAAGLRDEQVSERIRTEPTSVVDPVTGKAAPPKPAPGAPPATDDSDEEDN